MPVHVVLMSVHFLSTLHQLTLANASIDFVAGDFRMVNANSSTLVAVKRMAITSGKLSYKVCSMYMYNQSVVQSKTTQLLSLFLHGGNIRIEPEK